MAAGGSGYADGLAEENRFVATGDDHDASSTSLSTSTRESMIE
ncbi:hypothetical protein [Halomicrobium urmianum]|nr:hypothetical protein [Halomicrobium urmianum]